MRCSNQRDSLLIEEFKQAWAHYRHCENGRMNFLTFAMFLITGILGFTILALKDFNKIKTHFIALVCITFLIVVVIVILVHLLLVLIKQEYVLIHYMNVWSDLRKKIFGTTQRAKKLINNLDIHKQANPIITRKMYNHHHIVIRLIVFFIVLLIMPLVICFYFSLQVLQFKSDPFSWFVFVVMLSICLLLLPFGLFTYYRHHKYYETIKYDPKWSREPGTG